MDEKDRAIHINTDKSFFALLRHGHYGVYHQMSRMRLGRYVDVFASRWNHRKETDTERRDVAVRQGEGKRLTYLTPCRTKA